MTMLWRKGPIVADLPASPGAPVDGGITGDGKEVQPTPGPCPSAAPISRTGNGAMPKIRTGALLRGVVLAAGLTGCDSRDVVGPGSEPLHPEVAPSFATLGAGAAPELPRVYLDTRYPAPTGRTLSVPAGGKLQPAIDSARAGDEIVLAAGATYSGNFVLKPKAGTAPIVIRSSGVLPPEGTRVTPAHASGRARLRGASGSLPVVRTASGASRYRLVGLDVGYPTSITSAYSIVSFGTGSRDLVLDRSYVHGHGSLNFQRCVLMNSAATAVVDSYLSGCHSKQYDSQAIVSWAGPGPYKIANNYLEGAGENVMFGGAMPPQDVMPSDIEIRGNHFRKPQSWKGVWKVKNLFEIKFAQRVLLDGNVFEGSWTDGQTGFAFVIKDTPPTKCTWCSTQDITVRNSVVREAGAGVSIYGIDRIALENNLFHPLTQPGDGRLFVITGASRDVRIEHNTGFPRGYLLMTGGAATPGFVFRDNLVDRGTCGLCGTSKGEGTTALNYYFPSHLVAGNVIMDAAQKLYPSDNFFPTEATVTFVGESTGNYELSPTSPLIGAATDGTDPGADHTVLRAATDGVAR